MCGGAECPKAIVLLNDVRDGAEVGLEGSNQGAVEVDSEL